MDVIGTNTVWAHNVMVRGQDLVVCNSASGSLYSIEEKRDIWSVDGGGFITRGLASASGLLFAGLSAVAGRGDRKDCDAAICVVDLDTMRTVERFDFPRLGGIHEIRLLDIADTCHGGPVIRVPHRLLSRKALPRQIPTPSVTRDQTLNAQQVGSSLPDDLAALAQKIPYRPLFRIDVALAKLPAAECGQASGRRNDRRCI